MDLYNTNPTDAYQVDDGIKIDIKMENKVFS